MKQMTGIVNGTVFAMLLACALGAATAQAEQLLFEEFEDPASVTIATDGTDPTGWADVSPAGTRAGLGDLTATGYSNYGGDQAAWLNVYNTVPMLQTTSAVLNTNAQAYVRYDLSFKAASSTPYIIYADLLGGSNVILTLARTVNGLNFDSFPLEGSVLLTPDEVGVGEALSVRLRVAGGAWNQQCYVDNLLLTATDTSGDVMAPTPGTLQWAQVPTPAAYGSMMMRAEHHSDPSLVQYFFSNTVSGVTSGWQDSPIYTETGLSDNSTHSYQYRLSDKSANLNDIAGWSSEESATADATLIFYDSFETDKGYNSEPYGWDAAINAQTDTVESNDFITPYGEHSASIDGKSSSLTDTTYLTNVLDASTTYTVVYNVSTRGADRSPTLYDVAHGIQFFAGPTILAQTNAGPVASTNMTLTNGLTFTTSASDPLIGETLRLKLQGSERAYNDGALSGMDWQRNALYDNLRIYAVPAATDSTPPTPDPPQWLVDPVGVDHDMIYMRATNATDEVGVEYFFSNTVSGVNSGWQRLSYWCETNLPASSPYRYTLKVRDTSASYNETAWSSTNMATTLDVDPYLVFRESFESPDVTTIQNLVPPGWTISGAASGYRYIWDTYYYGGVLADPRPDGIFSTPSTSFEAYHGRQAARIRVGPTWQTTTNILDLALEDKTLYTLSFSAAQEGTYSGGRINASLLAGTHVLATTNTLIPAVATDLYQFTQSLEFMSDASHAGLFGSNVVVEVYGTGGNSYYLIDNIRLTAIPPPPAGCLFLVR
jgi:hypothetical protein